MSLDDFQPLPNEAMLTDNQAAAALANVSMYAYAFAAEIHNKAVERGVELHEQYAIAALHHIVEVSGDAAVKYAKMVGDEVRQTAFEQGVPPVYHVMSREQALAVDGDMREMAFAGAVPAMPDSGIVQRGG